MSIHSCALAELVFASRVIARPHLKLSTHTLTHTMNICSCLARLVPIAYVQQVSHHGTRLRVALKAAPEYVNTP